MDKQRMVIYQLLPRLFGNSNLTNKASGSISENGCGKLTDINDAALQSIRDLGATHVWYTGVIEHATTTSYREHGIVDDYAEIVKGKAGSPFAIKDYYDVAPDLAHDVKARLVEFRQLVERTHRNGLKVIIDFVPNHLARQYVSDAAPPGVIPFGANDNPDLPFSPSNNFYYLPGTRFLAPVSVRKHRKWVEVPARVTGNDCFSPSPKLTDWYETVKLNYGIPFQHNIPPLFDPVPDTWVKMREVILYWVSLGIDGFRCDMAGMVPLEFWRWVTGETRQVNPDVVFIAELYDPASYDDFIFKGGFDYLYDKVVFHDGLRAVMEGKAPAGSLTGCWQKTEGLHRFLLYFIENHDEQRVASDFFMGSGRNALAGMVVAATMFTNPLLLYFGQELGEKGMDAEGFSGIDGRTTIFDYWGIPLLKQWKSNGSWQGDDLPDEAKELRLLYGKLLNLVNQVPALAKGRFYDLMWVNKEQNLFNPGNLYAFIRYYKDSVILIIANFAGVEQTYKLRVPADVMQLAGLDPDMFFTGKDLLEYNTRIQFPGKVATNNGLGGYIKPFSAAIYQLTGNVVT